METEPLERIEEHQSGETPEDVAILYSWANLQGAKYRDFSANRREYRAQMRHRAAEQLRLMELRAQSEAEAAATHAEAEAAAAHAEADAATVELAASRSMPSAAPEEILREKEVEEIRRSSLREAAQQARIAAAERLEAARRAEAAALADSIARREEREIAEAQASALRQAAQYHDSELRSRQMMAQHPESESQVPGRISDPYSPQILAEGEYYDGPGTPPSELEASRFKTQREYIERSTGTELPQFKMPPLFREDHLAYETHVDSDRDLRNLPTSAPRRLAELNALDREYHADRHLREERTPPVPPRRWPGAHEEHGKHDSPESGRNIPQRGANQGSDDPRLNTVRQGRAEVVSRIPEVQENARPRELYRNQEGLEKGPAPRVGAYNASLLNEDPETRKQNRVEVRQEARRQEQVSDSERDSEWGLEPDTQWQSRDSYRPPAIQEVEYADNPRRGEQRLEQLYPSTPRPSGSWLRQISARGAEANPPREPSAPTAAHGEKHLERTSSRPSVEATYAYGQPGRASADVDQQPSGFRPPWLTQAQAPRPSGSRRASETASPEESSPQWLHREQPTAPERQPATAEPAAKKPEHRRVSAVENDRTVPGGSPESSQDKVASRWFALKGVFDRKGTSEAVERQAPRETTTTPIIAVYSLAGGVGKTSIVATLGRGLSSLGEKVLLVDTTSHGLLPYYFGASDLASGSVRTFTAPAGSVDAPIHLISYELDQKGSDAPAQSSILDSLITNSQQVHRVLLDMNGHCGWLIERLARLKPTILVPVAADMNSIVSLQAVEKRFAATHDAHGEPLRPTYLLNQFDASLPLHLDLREVLRQQLGDRLLPFVIRRNAGISEALAEGMTIVDYDPDSSATQDFLGLSNWIRAVSAPSTVGLRNLRWSER